MKPTITFTQNNTPLNADTKPNNPFNLAQKITVAEVEATESTSELEFYSHDSDPAIRIAVAENPNTAPSTLNTLYRKDDDGQVRVAAYYRLSQNQDWNIKRGEELKETLNANNKGTKKPKRNKLLIGAFITLTLALGAGGAVIAFPDLMGLGQQEADSPYIPRDPAITQEQAALMNEARETTNPQTLHELLYNENEEVQILAASNPNTTIDALFEKAGHPETSGRVMEAIVKNRTAYKDSGLTVWVAQMDEYPAAQLALAKNGAVDTRTLSTLAKSEHPEVRGAVANNFKTFPAVLKELAENDPDERVRNIAEQRLNQR